MAEAVIETPTTPAAEQTSIEMPNGVTLTGMGTDTEAIRESIEERHEELHPAPADKTEPTTPESKEPRGKKRFGQLTHEREEEKRLRLAAEERIKELEAKLAAPVIQSPVIEQPRREPVVTPPVETRPKPTEDMVGPGLKYTTYSDFVEDLSDWKSEQREAKLIQSLDARSEKRIEADQASRTRMAVVEKAFDKGRAAYSDFDAVLQKTTKLVPFEVQAAILKLPDMEHVIYALAKDDAKIDGLVKVMADPIALGIAVAQLPRVSAASPASTAPVVRTTNVPAPIQPVGAGTRTTKPSLQELAEQGRWDEYKTARAAGQIA